VTDIAFRLSPDRGIIDLDNPYVVRYWATKFGISDEGVVEAVLVVGNHSDTVRDHLEASHV
jgi:hypothetical protein